MTKNEMRNAIIISSFAKFLKFFKMCLFPAGNYMFKFNNRNTRTMCEIYSKLTPCSSVSIVNFEQANAGWVIDQTPFFFYDISKN